MKVKQLRILPLEVFKIPNNMNPEYTKEIFHKAAFAAHRPINLEVKENYTTKCRNKGLRCLGPQI